MKKLTAKALAALMACTMIPATHHKGMSPESFWLLYLGYFWCCFCLKNLSMKQEYAIIV